MSGEIHSIPGDSSPHQLGAAQGDAPPPAGGLANEQKNWLIDTGAGVSCITQENLEHFVPTRSSFGQIVQADGSVVAVQTVEGITMVFQVEDEDGNPHNLTCNLPIVVAGFDIIGNDQLAHLHVRVSWDADTGSGKLIRKRQVVPAG
jgi:hypothetical protein